VHRKRERWVAVAVSQSIAAGLFRGVPAYEPRTPWPPGWALLGGLLIVGIAILGGAFVSGPGRPPGVRWPQDTVVLVTLGVWQAATIVMTVAASALFGGRVREVLALRAPAGQPLVYVKALLLMVVLQAFVSFVQFTLFEHDMYADLRPVVRLFSEQWLLALLVVGVGAPLSEELL
jgi:hypothetical protein